MAKMAKKAAAIAGTNKGDGYAEARLDTGSSKAAPKTPSDGTDWDYGDATLDLRNDNGSEIDEMPATPGTPSESVARALASRSK